jgi:hypothetical protein
MLERLALLLLLASCGKSNPVTPPGTVLVDWDASKATRAEFAKATIGARAAKDYTFTVSPKDTPPYTLTVHVELADVDYVEAGNPVHQRAPVAIKATIKSNTGWELSGACGDGPNYKMPSIAPDGGFLTPMGMMQECTIREHRLAGMIFTSSWDIGFTIIANGDGEIKGFPDTDVRIE